MTEVDPAGDAEREGVGLEGVGKVVEGLGDLDIQLVGVLFFLSLRTWDLPQAAGR